MRPDAAWIVRHLRLLRASYQHHTGRQLLAEALDDAQAAMRLQSAPYALVSHDTRPEPVFNYANDTALRLFRMEWDEFTRLPSRLSAAPGQQQERARLLAEVSRQGYIDNYCGVRIAHGGQRFRILDATVWNLLDEHGEPYGQAALIPRWEMLP